MQSGTSSQIDDLVSSWNDSQNDTSACSINIEENGEEEGEDYGLKSPVQRARSSIVEHKSQITQVRKKIACASIMILMLVLTWIVLYDLNAFDIFNKDANIEHVSASRSYNQMSTASAGFQAATKSHNRVNLSGMNINATIVQNMMQVAYSYTTKIQNKTDCKTLLNGICKEYIDCKEYKDTECPDRCIITFRNFDRSVKATMNKCTASDGPWVIVGAVVFLIFICLCCRR